MTMDDDRRPAHHEQLGREALLVLLVVYLGGLVVIVAADRLIHLGSTLGNILFAALPLAAATTAAAWLHRHD